MLTYHTYLSRPEKWKSLYHPARWLPILGCPTPGHIGDPRNDKPGGYRRFERWVNRPLRACKLYWRHHQ